MEQGFGKICGFCDEVALGLIDKVAAPWPFFSAQVVEFRTTSCLRFGAAGWAFFTMGVFQG